MTEDELAAVIAAIRALRPRSDEPAAKPAISKWKLAARREATGVR